MLEVGMRKACSGNDFAPARVYWKICYAQEVPVSFYAWRRQKIRPETWGCSVPSIAPVVPRRLFGLRVNCLWSRDL